MELALRPSLFGNLSALASRVTFAKPQGPKVIRDFDPARQTLTLTVDNAKAGTEVIFRDTRAGCQIEVGGRTLAILETPWRMILTRALCAFLQHNLDGPL